MTASRVHPLVLSLLLFLLFTTTTLSAIIPASPSTNPSATPQTDLTPSNSPPIPQQTTSQPGSINVLIETTWESNTGIVIRFNFTTKPDYNSITFGYDSTTTPTTGCELLSYVPQNSFFITTWDNEELSVEKNCRHFDTHNPIGKMTPNTSTCSQDHVFKFDFLSEEIRNGINASDIIECFMYLTVESPAPAEDSGSYTTLQTGMNLKIIDPTPLSLLFPVKISPISVQSQTNAMIARDFFPHNQQRISVFELWFVKLPTMASVPIGLFSGSDTDLKTNLFEDLYTLSLQDRIERSTAFNYQCLRNAARLFYPVSDQLRMKEELKTRQHTLYNPPPPGPDTPFQVQSQLTSNSSTTTEHKSAQKFHIFSPQSRDRRSPFSSAQSSSTDTAVTPTTSLYLNTNDRTSQTFMCQFLFRGTSHTNQYTFTFGDQQIRLVHDALNLKNKIVYIGEDFSGQASLDEATSTFTPVSISTRSGAPSTTLVDNTDTQTATQQQQGRQLEPHSLAQSQIATQTSPTPLQTPLQRPTATHYKYTHTLSIQLPVTIFTNQIFTLELQNSSDFNALKLWFEIESTSEDIRAELVPSASSSMTPSSFVVQSDDEKDINQQSMKTQQTTPVPSQNAVIKFQYIIALPEEWNDHWDEYDTKIYYPQPNAFNHRPAPPTPPAVASMITTLTINTYVPVEVDRGFELFFDLFTVINSSSRTAPTHRFNYNPSNPLQFSYRPVIDLTQVTAQTDTILTTNDSWAYTISFPLNPLSLPSSPPSRSEGDYDDISEAKPYFDPDDGDHLVIEGRYHSPLVSPNNPTPSCTLYQKEATPPPPSPDQDPDLDPMVVAGMGSNRKNHQPLTSSKKLTHVANSVKNALQVVDKGTPISFDSDNSQIQGHFFRLWTPVTTYTNTDTFTLECTQQLYSGMKSTALYTNTVDLQVQLTSASSPRWYVSPTARRFSATLSYTVADEFNLDKAPTPPADPADPTPEVQKINSPIAFKVMGPAVINPDDHDKFEAAVVFEDYYSSALTQLRNTFYSVPGPNPEDPPTQTFPFTNLQLNQLMLLTNLRQEWMNSYNAHLDFSPYESFSVYGVSPATYGTLIMTLDPQYFTDNLIDYSTVPWTELMMDSSTDISTYRVSWLPTDTALITDPTITTPLYWYYIGCQYTIGGGENGSNKNISFSSLTPVYCPTAIGQQVSLPQQCVFDPLVTDTYLGISPDACGAVISMGQFREMENFWDRRENTAATISLFDVLVVSVMIVFFG